LGALWIVESQVLSGAQPGEHVPEVVECVPDCHTQWTVSPSLMVLVLLLLTVSVNAKLLMLTVRVAGQAQEADNNTTINLRTRIAFAILMTPASAEAVRSQPHDFLAD
jgi:hypothetical protein